VVKVDTLSTAVWVVLASDYARLALLCDTVDRRCKTFSSYALDFLHGGGCNLAGDTGDRDISAIFEAPSLDCELLTAICVALIGTDRVDFGMSANIPTLIASKVAMFGCFS